VKIIDIDPNDPHRQSFCWSIAGKEVLRLSPDGFFVEGRKVVDDMEVYRSIKLWLEEAWAMKTASAVESEQARAVAIVQQMCPDQELKRRIVEAISGKAGPPAEVPRPRPAPPPAPRRKCSICGSPNHTLSGCPSL
jgi:hypothetical protein